MPIPLLAALGIGLAAAIVAPTVGKEVATKTQTPYVQKQLQTPQVQAAARQAEQKVSKGLPGIQLGPVGLGLYDIPGVQAAYAGQTQKETQRILQAQGYSKADAQRIAAGVGAQKTGAGIGEGIGVLIPSGAAAGAATKIGKVGITKAAAASGGKLTGRQITGQVTRASLYAGAYEGGATTTASSLARRDRFPSPIEYAIGIGAGAGTAAAGGALLSTAYQRSVTGGRLADWIGSFAVDPYEKPGDILASRFIRGPQVIKQVTKKTGKKGGKGSVTGSPIYSLVPETTPSTTPSQTPSGTPTTTITTDISGRKGVGSVVVPVPTPDPTPTPPPPTPSPTQTPQDTPTTTPTTTASNIFTPIPSSTIMPRNIPPLPLPGVPPGMGAGVNVRGDLFYHNEYMKARRLLRQAITV